MGSKLRSRKASEKAKAAANKGASAKDDAGSETTSAPSKVSVKSGSLYQRVLRASDEPLSAEDLLEGVHWVRQVIGVVAGTLFGLAGVTGYRGVTTFLAMCIVVPSAYFESICKVDEEELSKLGNLKLEGVFSSFAFFLLSWILCYNTSK